MMSGEARDVFRVVIFIPLVFYKRRQNTCCLFVLKFACGLTTSLPWRSYQRYLTYVQIDEMFYNLAFLPLTENIIKILLN